MEELEKVHSFAKSIDVPTHFLPLSEAHAREPSVRATVGVLESPTTGIVDSHGLMAWLEGSFQSLGGECVFHSSVTDLTRDPASGEYSISISSPSSSSTPTSTSISTSTITTQTLINSAGLSAIPISNLLLPAPRHLKPYYAKGTYFSYSSPNPSPKPQTLIYPAPTPGHAGLGTHLTIDLAGRIRFGPDVEWITDPNDLSPNESRLEEAMDEISTYWPGLVRGGVGLDYCGVRPKLGMGGAVVSAGASESESGSESGSESERKSESDGANGSLSANEKVKRNSNSNSNTQTSKSQTNTPFNDFIIREEVDFPGFVNLLGIESPGLTSCLAIGEMVDGILYR